MPLLVAHPRSYAKGQDWTDEASPSSTNLGTTVTASATPHALIGTPTPIIASTSYEAEWIEITIHNTSTAATLTDALLNIYIGAGGSETLFIDSLAAGWTEQANDSVPRTYWFPVRIARGTRISAELRALIASDTVKVGIRYGVSNGSHWVGSGVETLGETTASSRGTAVTPATSAPSWVSIGTSGRRYGYVDISVQGNNDTTLLGHTTSWSIGTGSALLHTLGGFLTSSWTSEAHRQLRTGRWCDIPSSTALQLRAWAGQSPSGLQYASIHGVY